MYDHRVCPQWDGRAMLLEVILKASAALPVHCGQPDGQHWVNHPDVRLRGVLGQYLPKALFKHLRYLPRYYHPSGQSYRIGSASLDITAPA